LDAPAATGGKAPSSPWHLVHPAEHEVGDLPEGVGIVGSAPSGRRGSGRFRQSVPYPDGRGDPAKPVRHSRDDRAAVAPSSILHHGAALITATRIASRTAAGFSAGRSPDRAHCADPRETGGPDRPNPPPGGRLRRRASTVVGNRSWTAAHLFFAVSSSRVPLVAPAPPYSGGGTTGWSVPQSGLSPRPAVRFETCRRRNSTRRPTHARSRHARGGPGRSLHLRRGE